ncbi:hypothetical protein [Achromobacter sp. AONIH1]|uniref:hypothetical protein n=1 Tax=Achromobacter sp. AONIH1 TaxID=1758194 RepID=UPI000CD08B78|nr:hypothetical protein [Achromobacter sp. AONIH1]AUT50097.1 hypothetical protein C2U31_13975 [Achromobacter sp. AONIH1]
MTLVSRAEFARLHGVSHTAVSKWKKAGWLVTQGSQVDVEGSNAKLARYRDGKDGRAAKVSNEVSSQLKPETDNETPASPGALGGGVTFLPGESVEEAAERLTANAAVDLSMPVEEAKRIKEVYLALLNRLEYEQKEGKLIDLELAEQVVFGHFRGMRDAWLNWPIRVGPLIAADLGADAGRVTEVLNAHVHKQLSALGGEQADFSEG